MGPFYIIVPEYGHHDQEIWSFGQFSPQIGDLM
jgi:hypothetical protein